VLHYILVVLPEVTQGFLLLSAQGQGFVIVEEVQRRLSWTSGRVIDALETLLEVCICNSLLQLDYVLHYFYYTDRCNATYASPETLQFYYSFSGGPCHDRQWP